MAEQPVQPGPTHVLGLDTCGSTGGMAVARLAGEEMTVLGEAELAGRAYSADLVPALGDLLGRCSLVLGDLGAIMLTIGPGSFTGIRVGLSTAKGLAQATGIPVIGMSRLAVMAGISGLPRLLAVLDAGRGEYYTGEYRDGACIAERLLGEEHLFAHAAALELTVVACEERTAERLGRLAPGGHAPVISLRRVSAPTAADTIRTALPRYRAATFDDLASLDANYLRRSDAELFARPVPAAAVDL